MTSGRPTLQYRPVNKAGPLWMDPIWNWTSGKGARLPEQHPEGSLPSLLATCWWASWCAGRWWLMATTKTATSTASVTRLWWTFGQTHFPFTWTLLGGKDDDLPFWFLTSPSAAFVIRQKMSERQRHSVKEQPWKTESIFSAAYFARW